MRRLLLLLALLALVPLACGGEDVQKAADEVSPEAPIAQAAAKTRDAGSARFSVRATIEGGPAAGTMTGEGVFAGRKGTMAMDLSGLGGGGAFTDGKMEVVFDGLVFYLKFPPAITQTLPGGKPWIKMDLAALGKQQGIDFEQLMQLNQGDPSQSLDYLGAASDDFRTVGTERVRGAETTHYEGTVDLEKLTAQAPERARESYRRIVELSGTSEMPMDAWLDGDGLVRRLQYEQPLPGQKGASALTTIELYDFGVEVDVQPPPADDVLDIQDLIGGAS